MRATVALHALDQRKGEIDFVFGGALRGDRIFGDRVAREPRLEVFPDVVEQEGIEVRVLAEPARAGHAVDDVLDAHAGHVLVLVLD